MTLSSSNTLLALMILCYIIPIVYVCRQCNENTPSLSSILTSDTCQRIILVSMIFMGLFTLMYEYHRGTSSVFVMVVLLSALYGVISIPESSQIHYVCAGVVFISMIWFMKVVNSPMIFILIQSILSLVLCLCYRSPYFIHCEVSLLLNFAICYFYMHISK